MKTRRERAFKVGHRDLLLRECLLFSFSLSFSFSFTLSSVFETTPVLVLSTFANTTEHQSGQWALETTNKLPVDFQYACVDLTASGKRKAMKRGRKEKKGGRGEKSEIPMKRVQERKECEKERKEEENFK